MLQAFGYDLVGLPHTCTEVFLACYQAVHSAKEGEYSTPVLAAALSLNVTLKIEVQMFVSENNSLD